jgi:hypothetical protein
MSEEPKKRRSWGWIGWVLLAVFVLYPLSFGPACWVLVRDDSGRVAKAVYVIYWPLQRTHCEPFNRALYKWHWLWTHSVTDP